jgi:nuclease S1
MAIRVAAQVLLIHSALILFGASKAFAWGDDGHRIVCEIAFQLLDEAHRNEVIKLTSAYRRPNNGPGFPQFTEGCRFADEARTKARQKTPGWQKFEPFDRWHFLNVTRATPLITESDCNKNCVLFGIAQHIEGLKAAERVDRAEALVFLSHWLGDIHQPLHISYQDDLGGNEITTNGGFYASTHLHGVWDSGIIAKAIGTVGWRIFAQRLARAITPAEQQTWIASAPLVWAQESYNISTRPSAQYCRWQLVSSVMSCASMGPTRTLGEPYQVESGDDVMQRLQQAGARLADLLRRHLVLPSS